MKDTDTFYANWTLIAIVWFIALWLVGALGPPGAGIWFFAGTVWFLIAAVLYEIVRGWVSAWRDRRRRDRSRSSS